MAFEAATGIAPTPGAPTAQLRKAGMVPLPLAQPVPLLTRPARGGWGAWHGRVGGWVARRAPRNIHTTSSQTTPKSQMLTQRKGLRRGR